MSPQIRPWAVWLASLACAACDEPASAGGDHPAPEAGRLDLGADGSPPTDTRPADITTPDGLPPDLTLPDLTLPDALPRDAIPADVTPFDAAPTDTLPSDVPSSDATREDMVPADTAPPDMARCVDESCNGVDDDCDGRVDEAIAPTPCYDGPPETLDVGLCRGGLRACVDGVPGLCQGQILPPAGPPLVDPGAVVGAWCESIAALGPDAEGRGQVLCAPLTEGEPSMQVHAADADGVLSLAYAHPLGQRPRARPVVADTDADGDLDVLIASGRRIFRAEGSPAGLGPPVATPLPARRLGYEHLAVADVRGGPRPDLVLALTTDELRPIIAYATGSVDEGFLPWRELASVPTTPSAIVPADLDGDGDLDVLVTWRTQAHQGTGYLLNGDGGLNGPRVDLGGGGHDLARRPLYRDLDGDGSPELVTLIDGRELVQRSVAITPEGPLLGEPVIVREPHQALLSAVVALQLDCDPELELVVTAHTDHTYVYMDPLGQGQPALVQVPASDVVATDLDGDGDDDLALGTPSGPRALLVAP